MESPYNQYETLAKIDAYIDQKYTLPTSRNDFAKKPFFDVLKPWRDRLIKKLTRKIEEDFKAEKIKFIKK